MEEEQWLGYHCATEVLTIQAHLSAISHIYQSHDEGVGRPIELHQMPIDIISGRNDGCEGLRMVLLTPTQHSSQSWLDCSSHSYQGQSLNAL